MDWTTDRFAFTDRDFALFHYKEERESFQCDEGWEALACERDMDALHFEGEKKATVVYRSTSEDKSTTLELASEAHWDEWLETTHPKGASERVCVIICPRAPDFSVDEPSPASYVPFSERTFRKIASELPIHRGIARVITRDAAYFSSSPIHHGDSDTPSLVMTCRSSPNWRGDVAMAATFDPKDRTTFAIFFGCDKEQRRQIMGRLNTTEPGALAHPMLLPGIFAELERKRLTNLLERTLDKFTLQTGGLSSFDYMPERKLQMSDSEMNDYLDICYESQDLARECKCVKRQLSNIVDFCDRIDETRTLRIRSQKFIESLPTFAKQQEMLKVNLKIRDRTLEIGDELENKVDKCGMVLNNTSITMQTIWNHIAQNDAQVNTGIALDSKQDNSQMKSIALLTMIYLPISAVASIFSMSIFDWAPKHGVVSKYIWVFFVVTIVLTVFTVAVWFYATSRASKNEAKPEPILQEEMLDLEAGEARRFPKRATFLSNVSSTFRSMSFNVKKFPTRGSGPRDLEKRRDPERRRGSGPLRYFSRSRNFEGRRDSERPA